MDSSFGGLGRDPSKPTPHWGVLIRNILSSIIPQTKRKVLLASVHSVRFIRELLSS